VFSVGSTSVAAAILAAVEGFLPPGRRRICRDLSICRTESAGQDARLYGRQDACRYAKQIRRSALL